METLENVWHKLAGPIAPVEKAEPVQTIIGSELHLDVVYTVSGVHENPYARLVLR